MVSQRLEGHADGVYGNQALHRFGSNLGAGDSADDEGGVA
jgi:hypothetical protein